MTAFTLISKDNKVFQFDYVSEVNNVDDAIIIGNTGEIIVNQGNPITWPADASDGMQAIVDVKAGTLRFAYDGWPRAQTEFVVSNYSEPQSQAAAREEVMALVETWPTDWNKVGEKLTDDWIWVVCGGAVVIINQTDNIADGVVITENDWRNYLVKELRKNPPVETVTAASMLTAALGHMEDRAKTYDAPGGERSMGKTVTAFNVITGLELTEEQGWLFMEILKQVRSQQGDYRADSYEDMVAYAALRGECAARERGNK